jgi:diguanylate cyclase (GGDEF)-like protein/PAS domain S-box-containing protein
MNDQQELQTVLDATEDAVIRWLPNSNILSCNRAAEAIFGYTAQQLIGHPISLLIPPARQSEEHNILYRVMQGEKLEHFETVRVGKDGRLINMSMSILPVYDKQGDVCGAYQIARDITECKRTEQQLRIAEAIFNIHEAIVVTDANVAIIQVNQAFEDITGYSAAEALGKNPSFLKSNLHDRKFYESMWQQLLATDNWTGEIWDRRKTGEIFPKWQSISVVRDDDEKITHYVSSFADISERKTSEARVRHLAYHDSLTGLANRFYLLENLSLALELAKRNKKRLAIILLDLDNFKIINDTLGHPTGDHLLIQVAQRLSLSVRHSDFVARLGGDEFVIMLCDVDSSTDVAHTAEKILTRLSEPYHINGQELHTSPSIGICLFPDDATEDQDLIKKADVAMYHAKASGRANYQFFNEDMQRAALNRILIENELREALEKKQFILHYQPQLELSTGKLVGVEALIRWQHPVRGTLFPVQFITIAEEAGLINLLGDWVIQEACHQLAKWRARGITHLRMSVNLAASQFSDKNLTLRIQEIIAQNNLPFDCLDLEVTESMMMKSPSEAVATMEMLTSKGLTFTIDDFGTGYSSLAYLKLFPVSTLKIDRSFVKDIETDENDASICDITVLLAQKLGMSVIAEGVETEAQLNFLLSIGCEKIQGYLVSRPLAAEQMEHFIQNHTAVNRMGSIDLWR